MFFNKGDEQMDLNNILSITYKLISFILSIKNLNKEKNPPQVIYNIHVYIGDFKNN